MSRILEGDLDAKGLKVALVVARFNANVTESLLQGAQDCLIRHGADADASTVVRVPGAWEIPIAAKRLAATGDFHAIIGLGALIRGETPHFEILASEVAKGLAQVGMDSGIPVIFGVLTTESVEQAVDRAGAKLGNKGWDAALSAIEMSSLFRRLA